MKCCPAPPCPQQRNAPLRMPLAPSPHYPGLPPTVPRERDQRHEKHCRAAAEPPPANEFTKAAIKAQDEQLAALMAPRLAQAQLLQREALLLPSHAVPQAVGAGFGNALMVAGCGCACGRGGISMQASCAVQRGNLVCPLAWLRRLGCFALHASTPVWPLRPSLNAPSTLLPSLPPPCLATGPWTPCTSVLATASSPSSPTPTASWMPTQWRLWRCSWPAAPTASTRQAGLVGIGACADSTGCKYAVLPGDAYAQHHAVPVQHYGM